MLRFVILIVNLRVSFEVACRAASATIHPTASRYVKTAVADARVGAVLRDFRNTPIPRPPAATHDRAMRGNSLLAVAIVAFGATWVAAGIVTSKAISAAAHSLDIRVLLAGRDLALPVRADGAAQLQRRSGAIEIPAPQGSAVVATDSGRIARVERTPDAGVTVYQADGSNDVLYMYAHLYGLVDGVREGSIVKRGEVIGYLGAGHAGTAEPRLRFAILRFPQDKYWDNATVIDPLPYFVKSNGAPTLASR
jgi:hypothetical protein